MQSEDKERLERLASKLRGKQRAFADSYMSNGENGTQACRDAGYKGNQKTLGVVAVENLAKPSVKKLIESYAPKAALRVEELCAQEKNLNVALGAAKDILDRAGYKPVDKQATAIQGDINISWGGGGGFKEPNE